MADINFNILTVTIQNRDKTLFEGKAKAVTSLNEKGQFDILPLHSNFITVIKDYIIVHLTDGKNIQIHCHEGVLWVTKNVIRIMVDVTGPKTA